MGKRELQNLLKRAQQQRKPQAELIREVKAALGVTWPELAKMLNRSNDTVKAWLQREGTAKYRALPEKMRALLTEILSEVKRRK